MQKRGMNTSSGKGVFNTLVQSGTRNNPNASLQESIIVNGEGSDLTNEKALYGRAKRKTITQLTAMTLIEVVEQTSDSKMLKSLWNTYYCQDRINSSEGKYYGIYCKNRVCTVCCAIRKAYIINRYLPTISTWEDPHFVTLTMRTVKDFELKKQIEEMQSAFLKIRNRFKKRNQRDKSFVLLKGIKSLECNYNHKAGTYNPHYHLVVPNRAIGMLLIQEWKKHWKHERAQAPGQESKPVGNKIGSLIEMVKYGSKIFTELDIMNKKDKEQPRHLYSVALYNILKAMKGKRIFERFGFNLPQDTPRKLTTKTVLFNYDSWTFDLKKNDWINERTGKGLTGHILSAEISALFEKNVNLVSH